MDQPILKPFPFRALSPIHASQMDLDYLLRVIEAARKYGYNVIQICGEGNLDGITEFVKYAKANTVQDLQEVRRNREILRRTCQAAHEFGMQVYFWHHELWFPERLSQVYPDWFTKAPDNRFRRDLYVRDGLVPRIEPDAPFWDFMRAKFVEAFDQCPELDGTIVTIQESQVPIYCLFEDFDRQVDELVGLYRRLERLHKLVNRKWVLRTFAWREHEYRVVAAAVERYRPAVPVESKGVAMDWSLYYPYDPLLGRFEGMTRHVEVAPSCEFHGCTGHPVGHPWFYTENLKFAARRGHTGAVLRIDRAGQSMLGGPDEGVLAAIGAWLNDPAGADVGEVYVRWLMDSYGLDRPAGKAMLEEVMENCWQAALHTYHHDKIYIGDAFWQKYDKLFWIAERDRAVEWTDPAPLAEKDQAVEFADAAAAGLERLKQALAKEQYADLRRRVRLMQLQARAYRQLVWALVGRQRQMYEPSAANLAALRGHIDALEQAGAAISREFPELDGKDGMTPGQRQPGMYVRQFAQAWRADLANLPRREVAQTLTARELGANASHLNQPAHQPPAAGTSVELRGRKGAKHILAVFAGTQMCVRRPMEVRCGTWKDRFDVGQFAWFLAHDRFRRYEAAIPDECFDAAGRCTVQLLPLEPDAAPFISELRLETEEK